MQQQQQQHNRTDEPLTISKERTLSRKTSQNCNNNKSKITKKWIVTKILFFKSSENLVLQIQI